MRAKGIAYDTGYVRDGDSSRPDFDPELVERELTIIRDDLHCTAVQLVGGDPDRLALAARQAAALGLEVWFSPYPLELTTGEMLALFDDCARHAEQIRQSGADVVFVTGVELTVMARDFLPGNDVGERVARLLGGEAADRAEHIAAANARLTEFLGAAVDTVRQRFGGRITYACIPFERVDWALFDIMTVEMIRSKEVADRFRDGVRSLVAQGKPVAITGFGTATWRGAGDVAPRSMEIVESGKDGQPERLTGDYVRDEAGQAGYLKELLQIFDEEGVDSTFIHQFAVYNYPHRPDEPRRDLDMASPGVVKVLENRKGDTYPDMPWEPKAAFTTIADHYRGTCD